MIPTVAEPSSSLGVYHLSSSANELSNALPNASIFHEVRLLEVMEKKLLSPPEMGGKSEKK
jgi:hypothetical protein